MRSDGFGEYKVIFGFLGPFIYQFMFNIVAKISYLISCREYILRGRKGHLVSPSQIDDKWLKNLKLSEFDEVKLLFIGRIRKEKGIYSLVKLIENFDNTYLTIVGAEKNTTKVFDQKNVNVLEIENNPLNLINYYDNHNIFVLPSFTEGHPMVLLEALARVRPVIIFDEIKHVVGDKKGIFVSKRNSKSLFETINHIKKNILEIQDEIKRNQLPTNKDFIESMSNFISKLN